MIISDKTTEEVQDILEILSNHLQENGVECSVVSSDLLVVKNCFLHRNLFKWHLKCESQWVLLFHGVTCSVERLDNINHLQGHNDEDLYMIEDFLIRYSQYIEKYENG